MQKTCGSENRKGPSAERVMYPATHKSPTATGVGRRGRVSKLFLGVKARGEGFLTNHCDRLLLLNSTCSRAGNSPPDTGKALAHHFHTDFYRVSRKVLGQVFYYSDLYNQKLLNYNTSTALMSFITVTERCWAELVWIFIWSGSSTLKIEQHWNWSKKKTVKTTEAFQQVFVCASDGP